MKELKTPDPTLKTILPEQKLLSDRRYVKSVYAVPFEYESRHLLFNTLTRQLVEITEPLPESVTADEIRGKEEWSAFMRGYYLVPEGKDEAAFYNGLFQIVHALARKKGIRGFTILPTTGCNARCVYCFEEGWAQQTMTSEVAEELVRFIRDQKYVGEIDLEWFGGEPLTAVPIIDDICHRLSALDIHYKGSMVTNGSLITEPVADKMAGIWNIRHVQVSMDGDEPDYIARKQYLQSGDHYHTVLHNIGLLVERGIEVSVRCNVDEDNIDSIPSFLQDLCAAVPDSGQIYVYVSPLNAVRLSDRESAIQQKMEETEMLIRQLGFKDKTSRSVINDFRNFHCMADLGSVVIMPDGGIYACKECTHESRRGSVMDTVFPSAGAAFCRTDQVREKCQACPYLPECTPFAACPVERLLCREYHVRDLQNRIVRYLKSQGERPAGEQ